MSGSTRPYTALAMSDAERIPEVSNPLALQPVIQGEPSAGIELVPLGGNGKGHETVMEQQGDYHSVQTDAIIVLENSNIRET